MSNHKVKEPLYLPYPLQGLCERALGSALQLPKFLLTAAVMCLQRGWSCFLTYLHKKKNTNQSKNRAWWLVNVMWMRSSKEIVAAGVYVRVTFTSSFWVTECWWLLCFFSYSVLKEAMTNSFSSLSLLGQALWDAKTQKFQINSYFSNQHQP